MARRDDPRTTVVPSQPGISVHQERAAINGTNQGEATSDGLIQNPAPNLVLNKNGKPRKPWVSLTNPDTANTYLQSLADHGSWAAAARAANVSIAQAASKRANEPEWLELCTAQMNIYNDRVRAEVHRRAVDGFDRPIIGGQFKDQVVAYERVYSDRLLECLAKARLTEFMPKEPAPTTQINISNHIDPRSMTRAQRDAARVLLGGKSLSMPEQPLLAGEDTESQIIDVEVNAEVVEEESGYPTTDE